MRSTLCFIMVILLSMHAVWASGQYHAVFAHGSSRCSAPVRAIDSIKIARPRVLDIFMKERTVSIPVDSFLFSCAVVDTLFLFYEEDVVAVHNPRLDCIDVKVSRADVTVTATSRRPFVCMVSGNSRDGRLVINSDTTFTLVLAGMNLTSRRASAISLTQKQKARVVLADGTLNVLSDAPVYQTDSTDTSNGCLYAKGSLTFSGRGSLGVSGNSRHAISSGKSIAVEDGHIIIYNTVKDGLHCDKMQMDGGTVELHVNTDASKGIKCKEAFIMKGGSITGDAAGSITITDGDVSYCSLLKSDGTFLMTGGDMALRHQGDGGRCISVDDNMMITGGVLHLECHGDGGSYLTEDNASDYYTPKCITVDDTLNIKSGTLNSISTGLGGKGIVAGKLLTIGDDGGNGPVVRVETCGECVVNNANEDLRFGCPKGIKADEKLCIYGGDIVIRTAGMGGEGLECNGELNIYGGTLECITFDDGINVGRKIEIAGGQVYCCSEDNDGIDSNGSIFISGGIVASVNQRKPNESFDSEGGQLTLLGGMVFGIGSSAVEVKESSYPCYSTPYVRFGDGPWDRGLILTEGKYVYVGKGGKAIIALRNSNKAMRSFITVMSPSFAEGGRYTISEGDCPTAAGQALWDKLYIDCLPNNTYTVAEIKVQTY